MNIGALTATLGVDTAGLVQARRDMERWESSATKSIKSVNRQLESLGSKMKKVGRSMTTYLTVPILAVGGYAFKMAADMEESMNKVDVAFKDNSKEVKMWSETTLEAFGLAKTTSLEMVSLFGDMATGMGYNTTQASKMSKRIVELAADLSSFKNIKIGIAQTALSSIFTGETESLKKLGIVMTEVNLQEYARNQGIQKSITKMSQLEKVQLRYNFILEMTKNAHGDFERTSESTTNQMRLFTEQIKEVSATFGDLLLPILTPIIKRANELLKKIQALSEVQKTWVIRIAAIVAVLGPLTIALGFLVGNVLPGLIRTGMTAVKMFNFLKLAIMTNPIGALITGLTIAATILLTFRKRTKEAEDAQWKLGDAVKDTNAALGQQIYQQLVNTYKKTAEGALKAIGGLDKLSKSLTKLTLEELQSLKMWLSDEIPKAFRDMENASNSLTKTIIEQDLESYRSSLSLVEKELTKITEAQKLLDDTVADTDIVIDYATKKAPTIDMGSLVDMGITSSEVYSQMTKDLEVLEAQYKLFGNSTDYLTQKQNILKGAIDGLLNTGESKNSLAKLKDDYDKAAYAAQKLTDDTLELSRAQEQQARTAEMVSSAIRNAMVDIAYQMGQALAGAENGWLSLLNLVINTAAQIITQYLLMAAAAIISSETEEKGLIGLLTAAAGVGILAGMWSEYSNQFAGMKEGGTVPGGFPNDSYPAMLSSGETVLPAPIALPAMGAGGMGGEVVFKIGVRELEGILVQGNNFNNTY